MRMLTILIAAAVLTLAARPAAAADARQMEQNKKTVVDFYEKAINQKDFEADGDYVILHVHAVREPGTRGSAIVDIFKLENEIGRAHV